MASVWMDFLQQTAETEAERQVVSEVMKIKAVLQHKRHDESESEVCELLLSKLQRMKITVKVLQKTGIGKTVSSFQRHMSEEIRVIATSVVTAWKVLVDEYEDKIYKEEDDDLELQKNKENQSILANKPKRPIIRIKFKKVDIASERENCVDGPVTPIQQLWSKKESDWADEQVKRTNSSNETRSFKADSGKQKSGKCIVEKSIAKELGSASKPTVRQTGLNTEKERNGKVGSDIERKIEATKRKLRENYMEVERMKKKRSVQVIELHQGLNLPQTRHILRY